MFVSICSIYREMSSDLPVKPASEVSLLCHIFGFRLSYFDLNGLLFLQHPVFTGAMSALTSVRD